MFRLQSQSRGNYYTQTHTLHNNQIACGTFWQTERGTHKHIQRAPVSHETQYRHVRPALCNSLWLITANSKLMGEYLSINYDIPLFLCALHVIVLKCLVFIQIWSLGCIYSAISIFYQLRCDKLLFIDPFKNVIYLAIYLCVCVHVCRWVWVRWRCLWGGIIQQSKGHMTAVFEFHPHWFITLQSQTKTLHKMISRGRQLEQHSIVV